MQYTNLSILLTSSCLLAHGPAALPATVFHVGTYNLDNYLDASAQSRPAKTAQSKAKICQTLRRLQADVLALQEIGSPRALQELRWRLKTEGLDYPFAEFVTGFDTNIAVAVLSRFPIVARHPHTNEAFLLYGRRFRVSRGFAQIDVQINPSYRFTLIAAHLKSRRAVSYGDEADLREQEALILREKINAILNTRPQANLVVLGDFNDTKDSKPIRILCGRGAKALLDTRPAEPNGDNQPALNPRQDPRNITWTHYYGKEDSYSRIDYILLSRGMAREWIPKHTYILTLPNWGLASDHRPIVASFRAEDN